MAKANGASPGKIAAVRHRRCDAESRREIELIEAIEVERSRLMKAQSLLSCALVAMECEDNDNAPYYPDVLEFVQELLNQSIGQLDSLKLRPLVQALGRGAEPARSKEEISELDSRGENELRDSTNVIYIVSPNSNVPSSPSAPHSDRSLELIE